MSPTDDQTIDPGEVGCRAFLIGPAAPDPARLAGDLDRALVVGGLAAFLLRLGPDVPPADVAPVVAPICRRHDVAFLLQDDVAAALEAGADGVHLSGRSVVGAARAALGPDRIVGVSCRRSRDAAMTAGEHGADYVAFGEPEQPPDDEVVALLEWWNELFVLPCLAEVDTRLDDAARLARAGADFVAVRDVIWDHPEGAAAALRELRTRLGAR